MGVGGRGRRRRTHCPGVEPRLRRLRLPWVCLGCALEVRVGEDEQPRRPAVLARVAKGSLEAAPRLVVWGGGLG